MLNRRSLMHLAALGAATPGLALAQERFPSRAMRVIVPFAAGGSTDILGRICAQILSDGLGQPALVENLTGAGGTIGAARVLEAPADGYTILAGTPGPIAINPHLLTVSYQPLRDFAPVVLVGDSPAVVVVRRDSPIRNLADLIARARAAPGRMTFASAGIGSFAHLSGELFKWRAGVDLLHVSYRGTAPAATDLLGGQVDVMFENFPSVQSYISAGTMRVLAIGTAQRSSLLPGIPTVQEEGVAQYESTSWFGLFVRTGTPAPVIATLNRVVGEGVRSPALAQRLAGMGVEPMGGTPEAFRAYVSRRIEETGQLVRSANIRPQ